jgi:hypothetical protein
MGGIFSALLILAFFVNKSSLSGSMAIDNIRAIQYVSVYAGLTAAFLLFTLLHRESRIMWWYFAAKIGSFCLLGQFATMSRSDWLAALAAIFSIPFLLPKEGRVRRLAIFVMTTVLLFGLFLGGMYVGGQATGRNLPQLIYKRMLTALPFARGDDSYLSTKAWDTRLPGVFAELKYWLESPIIGQGFGYTDTRGLEFEGIGFNHNVWTAALATTGIVGFAAYLVPVLGLIVIGRRLVRDRVDKGSVLIGAIGFTTGIYHLIYGGATMSFNVQRGALLLGLIAGVVFRSRMMQLTQKEAYAGYLDDRIDRYE